MAGIVCFFDANNASGNVVQAVEDVPGQNFRPAMNDAIRSCKLYNVRPGAEIRLFDDASGAMADDFCIIQVKRVAPEYTVETFERTYEDEYVRVTFIRNDGLDGKVSRIIIN